MCTLVPLYKPRSYIVTVDLVYYAVFVYLYFRKTHPSGLSVEERAKVSTWSEFAFD